MSKTKLIDLVAAEMRASRRVVSKAVDSFLAWVTECLANQRRVTLGGFGTFRVLKRRARAGRNPRTGEPLMIPAALVVRFKAGKGLRRVIR